MTDFLFLGEVSLKANIKLCKEKGMALPFKGTSLRIDTLS